MELNESHYTSAYA